ncbi:hypothetical protein EV424DRAFT_1407813 [Suillus variegatus]|nr:hypothetical protein EV424DRAFT_1407813 [Suillus variegatus]
MGSVDLVVPVVTGKTLGYVPDLTACGIIPCLSRSNSSESSLEHFHFIDAPKFFSPFQLFESCKFSSNIIRRDPSIWKVICITRRRHFRLFFAKQTHTEPALYNPLACKATRITAGQPVICQTADRSQLQIAAFSIRRRKKFDLGSCDEVERLIGLHVCD